MGKPLNVVVRGASLSLPQLARWEHGDKPGLAVRYGQTYPVLFAERLEATTARRVRLINTSFRGMDAAQFEIGLGQGLADLFETLEPDIFIATFGYGEAWRFGRAGDIEGLVRSADHYAWELMRHAVARPSCTVVAAALPQPGPRLRRRYPAVRRFIDRFNERVSIGLYGNATIAAAPVGPGLLHADQQHFSRLGHRRVAEILHDLVLELGTVARARPHGPIRVPGVSGAEPDSDQSSQKPA